MRRILVLLCLAVQVPVLAQFGLPRPGDLLSIRIPGLDRILKSEPALATSYADAVTGIPFLDDFEPLSYAPLVEAPRDNQYGFLLGPGAWRGTLESYCLHAGTHGPSSGEGYLWAPLRGERAEVIAKILRETAAHPEIAQEEVQALLWGILARTSISDLPGPVRQAARVLLTAEEIRRLDGGVLGRIPEELMDRALDKAPPALRQALEAEARLRNLFAAGVYRIDQLEGVAILTGDPPPDPNDPGVPRNRWSYHAGGYLVRYDPMGYSNTQTDVYVPEAVAVTTDSTGRIIRLAGPDGSVVDLTYHDDPVLTVPGDDNVRGYLIDQVRLSVGASQQQLTPTNSYVLVGMPGGGTPRDEGPFTAVAERYAWLCAHRAELERLLKAVRGIGGAPLSEADAGALLPQMVNLASCHQALKLLSGEAAAENASALSLAQRAWVLRLAAIGDSASLSGLDLQASQSGARETMLASVTLQPALMLQGAWGAPGPGFRPLRPFRPGGDVAQPSSPRQRLGQSNRPSGGGYGPDWDRDDREDRDRRPDEQSSGEDHNGKEVLNRARRGIDWISKGKQVIDAVTDPVGTIAGQVGFGLHDQFQGAYFDWLFNTASEISRALGGDPPRADYDRLETPAPVDVSPLADLGPIPAPRAAALQALGAALGELISNLRAGQVSLDRLGGALQAGDEHWQQAQAAAYVHYKRAAGLNMMRVADCLQALVAELQSEGLVQLSITAQAYADYQERLRNQGFSAAELQAAHLLGLSDEQIAAELAYRLSLNPEHQFSNLLSDGLLAAENLRALGQRWASLPDYDLDDIAQWINNQP